MVATFESVKQWSCTVKCFDEIAISIVVDGGLSEGMYVTDTFTIANFELLLRNFDSDKKKLFTKTTRF